MIQIVGTSVFRLALLAALVVRRLNLEVLKRAGPRPTDRKMKVSVAKVLKGGVQIFLGVQTLCLSVLPISSEPRTLQVVGGVLFALAVLTTILSRRQLGRSWVDIEEAQILPSHELVTTGIYRWIRHPIYAADQLLFVGLQLALNSWLVLLIVVIVPLATWRASREEEQLSEAFPGYREYAAGTKRFVPFIL